jgi:hypothetical protein
MCVPPDLGVHAYGDQSTWQKVLELDFIIITERYLLNIQTLHLAIITHKNGTYN